MNILLDIFVDSIINKYDYQFSVYNGMFDTSEEEYIKNTLLHQIHSEVTSSRGMTEYFNINIYDTFISVSNKNNQSFRIDDMSDIEYKQSIFHNIFNIIFFWAYSPYNKRVTFHHKSEKITLPIKSEDYKCLVKYVEKRKI